MEMQNVERVNKSNFEDILGQPPFDCKSCICFEYPHLAKKLNKKQATEKKKEWFEKSKEISGSGGTL
jgi:hypothetical protein